MSTARPTTQGGSIAVSDSDELATLDINGLPVGTVVWNEDVGAAFKLTASDRTAITIDPTDGYDSGVWTFANATFTGFEDCTLLISLVGEGADGNASFGGAYTIDTVDSPTEVEVTPSPDGTTTAPIVGSVTLFDDALVTDSVVSAAGTIGVRWVVAADATGITQLTGDVTAGPGSGSVASTIGATKVTNAKLATMATHTFKANVTAGTAVPTDITATQLTAELNVATTLLQGAQSTTDKAAQQRLGATLTDADATIQPQTGQFGRVILPPATLTADRVLTLGNTGLSAAGLTLQIVIQDLSAHTYTVKDAGGSTIATKAASPGQAQTFLVYFNSTNWIANIQWWVD